MVALMNPVILEDLIVEIVDFAAALHELVLPVLCRPPEMNEIR